MNRMKKLLGGTAVTLYFIYGMGLALLILIFMPIGFLMDVDTILTSGQAPSSLEGIELYEKLIEKANGEISILAGGGIKASTIEKLLEQTSLTAFHMSGKIVVESGMEFRNPTVSMGLPGISEYNIWLTDENNVREARRVLDGAAK